jgi:hypothetical protein
MIACRADVRIASDGSVVIYRKWVHRLRRARQAAGPGGGTYGGPTNVTDRNGADSDVRTLCRVSLRQEEPGFLTEMLGLHYRNVSDEIWAAVSGLEFLAAAGLSASGGDAAP